MAFWQVVVAVCLGNLTAFLLVLLWVVLEGHRHARTSRDRHERLRVTIDQMLSRADRRREQENKS